MLWLLCLVVGVCSQLALADSTLLTCPPPKEGSTIKRLKSSLLCNYDPQERPVKYQEDNVTINVYFKFRHLSFIYDKNEFDLSAWIFMEWQDEFLTWNPNKFDNIKSLNLRTGDIWFPDVIIVNTDMKQHELLAGHTCNLESTGHVYCVPQLTTQVYCEQDLTLWPFDKQKCILGIISYSQASGAIDFALKERGHTGEAIEANNEWYIYNVTAERVVRDYEEFSWIALNYYIKMRRYSALYATTIVAPAFITSALTLLSFWVQGIISRVSLCCTALMGDTLCLLYIGSRFSASGTSEPNIALFYRDGMIMTIFALIIALSVENLRDQRTTLKAPNWLMKIASWLRGRGRAGHLLLGDGDVEAVDSTTTPDEVKTSPCSSFATLLDRLAFLALLCTCSVMLAALIP